jgi:signal transduction histidine kinase
MKLSSLCRASAKIKVPTIESYSAKPTTPVSLEYLLEIGKEKDHLNVAQYVHHELPIRLARRIKSIQLLPFIVGINPHIRSIYELYHTSFTSILSLPEPVDETSQELLAKKLDELTASHLNVIPILAKGFAECGKYMKKDSAQSFLDGMIQARIGIRLIAEHFLGLKYKNDDWVGVVNKYVSPSRLINQVSDNVTDICEMNYGCAPQCQVNGRLDTALAYVPVHLEYILTELLKNAMRATVEYAKKTNRHTLPDLLISIAQGESDVTIRIRDEGGGIDPRRKFFLFNGRYVEHLGLFLDNSR